MDKHVLIKPQVSDNQLTTIKLLRKRIKVNEEGIENVFFKIAETKAELESAYHLIHEIYIKNGYMNPSPSRLRFGFYNAMPYTQTFIGNIDSETMVTMTLFPDSPLGLPLDDVFRKEADCLRSQGRYLAEVGGLGSVINNQNAIMHLIKILYCYAEEYQKVDDLLITVHPKHKNFYKIILGFEEIGETKSYAYVMDNPAVALKIDLHKYREDYWNFYPREPLENDLYHFFFIKNSNSISLPEKKVPLHVWNPKLFDYFFKEKTSLYAEADSKTKDLLQKYYTEYAVA